LKEAIIQGAKEVTRQLVQDPNAAFVAKAWAGDASPVDLVVVDLRPSQRIRRNRKRLDGTDYDATVISSNLFERDINRGSLGEIVAASLLEPYLPIMGTQYLAEQEDRYKRRVVMEELENLALRFQDLLLEILIDPRFFYHVKMQRRAKIYPPSRSEYLRTLRECPDAPRAFEATLRMMASSGLVNMDERVRITRRLLDTLPKPGESLLTPFREVELAVRRLASYGIASNAPDNPLISDINRDLDAIQENGLQEMPDPKSFLFLPTGNGLVTLDDGRSYGELSWDGHPSPTKPTLVKRIGGALNFVYLVEYPGRDGRRRFVAKTFQNWYGLKWIPLSIWTIGSQNFDILGERRLSNEYRMNRKLRREGLNAPEIHHVSVPSRTIVEEFIPGRGFDKIAQDLISGSDPNASDRIAGLGAEISKVHERGVTLGDSKPDNVILDSEGRIWFVDLEQASEGGEPTWDLAEFLYYSGHYSLRWQRVKPLVESFLEGYLREGDPGIVGEIGSARYKRIFGLLTAPHIILGIGRVCGSYCNSS
jgi:tRNA A-37 threonylcarbamoyl transferase component Bud32